MFIFTHNAIEIPLYRAAKYVLSNAKHITEISSHEISMYTHLTILPWILPKLRKITLIIKLKLKELITKIKDYIITQRTGKGKKALNSIRKIL